MEKRKATLKLLNWVTVAMGVVLGGGVWLIFGKGMPPMVPIWYSRPWGEAQLAKPEMLLIIPLLAVGAGGGIGLWVEKISYETLQIMMLVTSIVVQLILLAGLVRIVWLVV